MLTPPSEDPESPDISDLERLIELNSAERLHLIERESLLRQELRQIIRQRLPAEEFELARDRERQARAELSRNLEHYDVLVEKWAEEGAKAAAAQ